MGQCAGLGTPERLTDPPTWGVSQPVLPQIVDRGGIRVPPHMTVQDTQPIEILETAEPELPPQAEPPTDEDDPGRPGWEPDDGDFT